MSLDLKLCQNEQFREKYTRKVPQVCCTKKCPNSAKTVKKQLAWCKLNRQGTVNEHWSRVIFSDECKVEVGVNKRVLVWRRPGEQWTPPCLNPGHGTRISLMIWGCITYEGMGTITIVNGNINAANYIDILLAISKIITTYTLYQEDNAPVHRDRFVKEYIDRNQIICME